MFHLIKDDKDAMLMTELVRGHGQIRVYVEYPIYEHDEHDFMDVSSFEGELAYDAYYNGKGYFDDFD